MALSLKQRLRFFHVFCLIALFILCLYKIWVAENMTPITLFVESVDAVLNNIIVYKLLSSILLLINVIVFQYIMVKIMLINRDNIEPIFIYLLVSLMFPSLLMLPSLLLVFVLLFFVSVKILSFAGIENPYSDFIVGLIIGVLSLIYSPFIFLIGFVFIAYSITKSYSWKHFVLPLLGVILAYIYYFSILYICDYEHITDYFLANFSKITSFRSFAVSQAVLKSLVCTIAYLLLFFVSMIKTLFNLDKELIVRRKQLMIVLLSSLLAMALYVLYEDGKGLTFAVFSILTICQLALSMDIFRFKPWVYAWLVLFCVINNVF